MTAARSGVPATEIPATASKFEQPLVLKQPQRAEDGIRVDSKNGREVWWDGP